MKTKKINITIKVGDYFLQDLLEVKEEDLIGLPPKGIKERLQMLVDEWVLQQINYEWEDCTDYIIKPDNPHNKTLNLTGRKL